MKWEVIALLLKAFQCILLHSLNAYQVLVISILSTLNTDKKNNLLFSNFYEMFQTNFDIMFRSVLMDDWSPKTSEKLMHGVIFMMFGNAKPIIT